VQYARLYKQCNFHYIASCAEQHWIIAYVHQAFQHLAYSIADKRLLDVCTGVEATIEVIHIDTEPPLSAAAKRTVAALQASSAVQPAQSANPTSNVGSSSSTIYAGKALAY
jgi:hypothetical protein